MKDIKMKNNFYDDNKRNFTQVLGVGAPVAHVAMTQDLQQVCQAIGTREGVACVGLVSSKHPHFASPQFQSASPERKIKRFRIPYDEILQLI